jgi:hypothetical protein
MDVDACGARHGVDFPVLRHAAHFMLAQTIAEAANPCDSTRVAARRASMGRDRHGS